ncbi:MAG TPA: hypothetical protein VGL34_15515 [Steroidobacteraceae bacterium]
MSTPARLTAGVFAIAAAFVITATPVRAQTCMEIVDTLKQLSHRVMDDKDEAKSAPAICAAISQVLGIVKATREVAAWCYKNDRTRSDVLLDFDKTSKQMESQIDSVCK